MHASAFIAMGTNMPFGGVSGADLLAQAITAMRDDGFEVASASGVWLTPAWPPGVDQPDYHNAVIEVANVALPPSDFFERLAAIERQFGRERRERWAARTLDLDIVAMGDLAGVFGDIAVPHPRMHERAFVLAPLAELAPDWRHPILDRSALELLNALEAVSSYRRLSGLAVAVV